MTGARTNWSNGHQSFYIPLDVPVAQLISVTGQGSNKNYTSPLKITNTINVMIPEANKETEGQNIAYSILTL